MSFPPHRCFCLPTTPFFCSSLSFTPLISSGIRTRSAPKAMMSFVRRSMLTKLRVGSSLPGKVQLHGTTEVARFPEGFLVLVGESMPEELTLQLWFLADGVDDGDKRTVSGGFQGKTGIGVRRLPDFDADGNKWSLAVLKRGHQDACPFPDSHGLRPSARTVPLHLVGVNALEGLFLLPCIVRRIDTGGIQHLLIGEGTSGALSHLGEPVRWQRHSQKGTLKKFSGVGFLNGRMKLERKFSKALPCLSNFRKLCSCSAVGRNGVFSPSFSSAPARLGGSRFCSLTKGLPGL